MTADARSNLTANLIAGIALMLAGLVLALDRFGVVPARELLRFWPVLLIVLGAVMVMQALRAGGDSAGQGGRDRPAIPPGVVVLLAVVFLLVSRAEQGRETSPHAQTAHLFAIMGRDDRASVATAFRGGGMTTILGRTHLDLRQASIAPGEEAVIEVVGVMGRVVLQVPPDWVVDVQAVPLMAAVKDERPRAAGRPVDVAPLDPELLEREGPPVEDRAPPRVVVRGVVLMGALSVR